MFTQKGGSAQGYSEAGEMGGATSGRYKLRPGVARSMMARNLARRIGYIKLGDLAGPKQPIYLDRSPGSGLIQLRFKAGERVYPIFRREPAVLILERGSLNVLLDTEPDRLLIKRLEADAIFGEMPLLGISLFGAVVEAVTAARVAAISEAGVARIMAKSPRLVRAWTRIAGPRLFESERLSVLATYGSLRSRVIYELLLLADDRPLIQGTHQDIADRLGTDRASVSRVLAGLERGGAISMGRGRIAILDFDALRGLQLM